ncbi:hypothetical protein BDN72DRAFT_769015, partial [Pluteus cervinus]
RVVYLNPSRVLKAIDLLRSDSSPRSVQNFQDASADSGISSLKSILQAALSSESKLRTQTTHSQIQGALSASRASLRTAKQELDLLANDITQLRDAIEETQAAASQILLNTGTKNSQASHAEDSVASAVRLSERDVRKAMETLTLWRILWHVDDVCDTVSDAVKSTWCTDLEKLLAFHTGKLSVSQQQFTKSAFILLSKHPNASNSNLLHNKLSQLTVSPSYTLVPNILVAPLKSRQSQILNYPTPRLHQAAQKAVIRISSGMAAGAGFSWAGWFGWLTTTQDFLLSFLALDPATSIGTGALIAISSVWWAGSRWDHAKAKWWGDWTRIGQGLDRDLKVSNMSILVLNLFLITLTRICLDVSSKKRLLLLQIQPVMSSNNYLSNGGARLKPRKENWKSFKLK